MPLDRRGKNSHYCHCRGRVLGTCLFAVWPRLHHMYSQHSEARILQSFSGTHFARLHFSAQSRRGACHVQTRQKAVAVNVSKSCLLHMSCLKGVPMSEIFADALVDGGLKTNFGADGSFEDPGSFFFRAQGCFQHVCRSSR